MKFISFPVTMTFSVVMEVERDFLKPDSEKFVEIVKNKVRRIAGVSQTKTLIPLTSKIKN